MKKVFFFSLKLLIVLGTLGNFIAIIHTMNNNQNNPNNHVECQETDIPSSNKDESSMEGFIKRYSINAPLNNNADQSTNLPSLSNVPHAIQTTPPSLASSSLTYHNNREENQPPISQTASSLRTNQATPIYSNSAKNISALQQKSTISSSSNNNQPNSELPLWFYKRSRGYTPSRKARNLEKTASDKMEPQKKKLKK